MLERTVLCVVDNHSGSRLFLYIERGSSAWIKCVDVGRLFLQGDILESTRLFVQQIQSGTCPNPHVSVVLFCNGGDGIYSGIQTDGSSGTNRSTSDYRTSGPDISFGVFYNVADILVRTNVVRIEQVRGRNILPRVSFYFILYTPEVYPPAQIMPGDTSHSVMKM